MKKWISQITLWSFIPLLVMPVQFAMAQSKPSVFEKSNGSSADSNTLKLTKMKKSQVLTYDFVKQQKIGKISSVPKLNIGEESKISFNSSLLNLKPLPQFASAPLLNLAKSNKANMQNTETLYQKMNKQTQKDFPLKQVKLESPQFQDMKTIEYPQIQTKDESQKELKEITKYTDVDLKILEAIILYEIRKEPEIGLGIMAEILNKNQSPEAYYHYARMALELGLNIEYRNKMLLALQHKKSGEYKKYVLKHVLANPQPMEPDDVGILENYIQSTGENYNPHPHYYLLQGKHFNRTGELKEAISALSKVDIKSKSYVESIFLQGVIAYKTGQLDRAITELEKIIDLTEKDPKNNLRSLGAITLGRMYFQKAEFKKSYETFRKVDRGHALWFEAMAEQAWAQIMIRDYEGASGNMFSLHTDYFKNVYAPETFLIRSVGYLNLCQYGDGMKVLVELGKKYFPIKEKVDKFNKEKLNSTALYEKLKLWAKNPDLREIDGLPTPLVVQAGRDPEFLGLQKKINQREDEINQFNQLFLDLLKGEKQAVKNENPALQSLYRQSRSSLKYVRTNTIKSLNDEIDVLKGNAAKALNGRFKKMTAQLDKIIDNHEILYYEVYSGAGEHLRFQSAGGKANEEVRPEMKGEKGKTMVWKFVGEIWEDEIGNYRSSLKSVCPEDEGKPRQVASENQGA